MGTRGRISSSQLSVVSGDGIAVVQRPQPPGELSAEMAIEWRLVVNRMRADWFSDETHKMLVQYCRHVVAARRCAELIAGCVADLAAGRMAPPTDNDDDDDHGENLGFRIKDYDRLLKMQERESRAITTLATKMRLTQQSTYEAKTKKNATAARKPWQTDDA